MIIIGIDPGMANTGYGVIKVSSSFPATQPRKTQKNSFKKRKIACLKKKSLNLQGKNLRCLEYGVIKTSPLMEPAQRLNLLYSRVCSLLKKYRPKILVVEKIYFFKNLKTALPVSEAKGVILLAAAKNKISIQQITPLEAKMGITNYGRANKEEVQKMVKEVLNLTDLPKPDDAADALALALCYSRTSKE